MALWGSILLLALTPTLKREPHTDEAWALHLADRVLNGARLGTDFIEVNPPIYIWKSIPAVVAHRAVGLPSWTAFVLLLAAGACVSLFVTSLLLRSAEPDRSRRNTLILMMGFCVLVLPRTEYSQREQLALILTLPFATLAAIRAGNRVAPRALTILGGGLAAIGFSLKPFFLVPWVILEAYLLRRKGFTSLARTELRTLVLTGLLYFTAILLFARDYFPLISRLAPVYHTYLKRSVLEVVGLAGLPLLLIGGVALSGFKRLKSSDPLFDVYALMYGAFLTAAVVQQKGFPYHYLTAWGYGLLLLVRSWQTRQGVILRLPSGLVWLAGVCILVGVPLHKCGDALREVLRPRDQRYRHNLSYESLLPIARSQATGKAVAVFSTSPSAAWPLISDAGARTSFRYMSLWPLAAIYYDQLWHGEGVVRPNASRTGFEARFVDEVVQDLERNKPQILLVLEPDSTLKLRGASRRIDYLGYFVADPRFQAFMKDYTKSKVVGLYGVWIRGESQPSTAADGRSAMLTASVPK